MLKILLIILLMSNGKIKKSLLPRNKSYVIINVGDIKELIKQIQTDKIQKKK